jgi:hypothetical protein
MKNKRGSHVGIVLSFVIFITFLIFLYAISEPAINAQKGKETLLNHLKIELMKKFSTNLTSVSLAIDKEYPQPCIDLQLIIPELNIAPVVIVHDKSGKIFPNRIVGENLEIDRGDNEEYFFKIHYSEELEEVIEWTFEGQCRSYSQGQYTIGLVRKEEYIFDTKVIDLINRYKNDYEGLKNELKIPLGNEFGFGLIYSDETKIETKEQNKSTDIYVEEIPVQYVNAVANISLGFINIQVW